MRIAGVKKHSFVDGDGIRYVIFTQGCKHYCPGCQNPDTWDMDGGFEIEEEHLAKDILQTKHITGITLSGGDPYYQWSKCTKLLSMLPGVNVWIYTGYEYSEIKDNPLTNMADAVVTGPFIASLKCEGHMYGSSNQEIHYNFREGKK